MSKECGNTDVAMPSFHALHRHLKLSTRPLDNHQHDLLVFTIVLLRELASVNNCTYTSPKIGIEHDIRSSLPDTMVLYCWELLGVIISVLRVCVRITIQGLALDNCVEHCFCS